MEECKIKESMQSSTTPDLGVANTQENIADMGAKRSALSQQVTTRLHDTDKTT